MKRAIYLTILIIILLGLKLTVFSQPGQLDPTFGEEGIVMHDLSGDLHETIWDMEILDDSTILNCGTINVGNVGTTDGFLLKLSSDGSIDESWGEDGLVIFDLGEDTYAYKMEVLPDGKILVCGTAFITASNSEFFVVKFNSDGSLDVDFGINGVFTSSHSDSGDECYCMAIQDDQKIVLGGTTGWYTSAQMLFVRLNPNGTIDDTFGNSGYVGFNSSTQAENINGIDLLSDGSIVGVGYSYQSDPIWVEIGAIVMIDEDGNPVNTFGDNGLLIPSWMDSFSYINDLEVKEDNIYITGWIQEVNNDVFLAKFDANGEFDPSFATNGVAYFNLNIIDNAFDLYFGADQKIYLAGNTGAPGAGGSKEFLLVRYTPDGSIDISLNGTGHVETEIRIDSDAAFSIKLQADGKIVLAGMSSGMNTSQGNNVALVRYLNDYIPLNANFIASPTEICKGETVKFTDQSAGNISTWEWFFEGGNPETTGEQNPVVYYETAGAYDVQLIISDGTNYDTLLLENYIIVNECTGVENNFDKTIEVYPNPVSENFVNIYLEDIESIETISISNSFGQVLASKKPTCKKITMDISDFKKGVIYIKVIYKNGLKQIEKLVKL